MKTKNVIFMMIILLGFTFVFSSCDGWGKENATNESDQVIAQQTEQTMSEMVRQTGMPAIINWQEKKTLKWIYELCDQEKMICHAYLFNALSGEVGQYLGKCYGYGIPYSAQYSNPERIELKEYNSGGWGYGTLPQPEPNGIFKPEGLSATWLIMIDPKTGEGRPVYVEPAIIVSPFPLH